MEMLTSYTTFVAYGVSLLLKAGVILAAAWFVSWVLRRRSAGLRHVLWSTAFAAILVLPIVSVWMPAIEVDVSHLETLKQRVFTTSEMESGNTVEVPLSAGDGTSRLVKTPVRQSDVEAEATTAPARPLNGVVYAFFFWLAGAGGLAAVFLVHVVRIRGVTRNAVSKQCVDRVVASVRTDLGLEREARVLVGQVEMPVTWGLIRPVVLLPVEAIEWDERRLRIVLMHELAHIRRKDYLSHLIAELACIAYWPNPLVWVARHRMRAEQEQACDDVVLRAGTASHDYAAMLLDVAQSVAVRTLLPGGISMAERTGLKARIRSILDPEVDRGAVSAAAFAVILFVVAVPALPMAALRSADAAQEGSEERQPSSRDLVDAFAVPDDSIRSDPFERSPSRTATSQNPTNRWHDSLSDVSDPVPEAAFTLTVEAERGRIIDPMTVRDDERASGGKYVFVPDGPGNDPPEGGPGRVDFDVNLEEAAGRAVWARVRGDTHNDNSFYVSVDGSGAFRWDLVDPEDGDPIDEWTWLMVTDLSGEPLQLESGTQTLSFRNREDGSRLDAVFVTSDPGLVPRGRSPLHPPARTVSTDIEAESPMEIVPPFEVRTDIEASGRYFVSVAEGYGSRREPPGEGRLTYPIEVPEAGRFVVWARAMGPGSDEDSFWIRANEEEWVRWNGIEDDDEWEWQLVHDSDDGGEIAVFPLHAGRNVIQLAYRENNARLDRIVVTNNVYQHPATGRENASGVSVTFRE